MAYKYKNESKDEQILIGIGLVKAGEEIVSKFPIENPNFTYVGEVKTDNANGITGTEAPQPNAVIEATPAPTNTSGTEVNQ